MVMFPRILKSSNNSRKCTSVLHDAVLHPSAQIFLLKVIAIATQPQTCYRSFGFVVQMILVVDFMGNAIKSFQKPLASVLLCMDDSECFQKSLFFFRSNLS